MGGYLSRVHDYPWFWVSTVAAGQYSLQIRRDTCTEFGILVLDRIAF